MVFLLIGSGFITGLITGITGASGVLIIVPLLTTFFDNISLTKILGTSLVVDVIASIPIIFNYYRFKNLNIKKGVWIIAGSLLGAQIGSFWVTQVSKIFIIAILAICIFFFGFQMLKRGISSKEPGFFLILKKFSPYFQSEISLVALGFLIGLITGIFGAGGGLFIFLILYLFLDFPIKIAVGTSVALMALTALSGVIGYIRFNDFSTNLSLIVSLSAAFGGFFSSMVANKISDKWLTKIIGSFFILLSFLMISLKIILPNF